MDFIFFVTVKVGIGGFSMGAAVAQYSATCFAMGRYGNGIPYPVNLRAVVGLSGWLPGSMYDFTDIKSCVYIYVGQCSHTLKVGNFCLCRSLRNKIEVSHEARRRAASLPLLLGHGICTYSYNSACAYVKVCSTEFDFAELILK